MRRFSGDLRALSGSGVPRPEGAPPRRPRSAFNPQPEDSSPPGPGTPLPAMSSTPLPDPSPSPKMSVRPPPTIREKAKRLAAMSGVEPLSGEVQAEQGIISINQASENRVWKSSDAGSSTILTRKTAFFEADASFSSNRSCNSTNHDDAASPRPLASTGCTPGACSIAEVRTLDARPLAGGCNSGCPR